MSRWIGFVTVIGLALLGLGSAETARAATVTPDMLGDTVTFNYLYPDTSTVYTGFTGLPSTRTVVNGTSDQVTVSDPWYGSLFTINVDSNSIVVKFLQSLSFNPATFSGISISGITQTISSISQTGGQAGIVSVSGNNVLFNFSGLSFNRRATITATPLFAQITPPGVVPVPATLPMLGAGLLLLGLLRKRRTA
ncbi:MAG: PEP-CTERM sorting domain-containing protein [Paracoccaceae bacterium]|nr:PEP-CTERM sorting domain-containing protein [Paracoccaceae bacterium]MDE3239929.1 PEP-CTERM sorting domain-containing protein [Paracoccaceae bacterium]